MMRRRQFLGLGLAAGAVPFIGGGAVASAQTESFPQVLRAHGRYLAYPDGTNAPLLRGFDTQIVPWSQTDCDAMVAKVGGRGRCLVRLVVHWDEIEPAKGQISPTYMARLDTQVSRLVSAGAYMMITLYYGPHGHHSPAWTGGGSNMSTYLDYGHHVTQTLATRFGHRGSPHYTPAVIGWELNEITPDYMDKANWLVHLYAQQAEMITWFRAYAPDWIGVICSGFGCCAPYANAHGSGQTRQTFTTPSRYAFKSAGGNIILSMHDYFEADASGKPGWDGRTQWGGPGKGWIKVKNTGYPTYPPVVNGVPLSRAVCLSQHKAYIAPYLAYSAYANCPLLIEEFGWGPQIGSVRFPDWDSWIADAVSVWGVPAGMVQWIYSRSRVTDPLAVRPGQVYGANSDGDGWLAVTDKWLAST